MKGFLCPAIIRVDRVQIKIYKKLNQNAYFLYITPLIRYGDRQYILILDFRYFSSAGNDFFEGKKLLFRLRKEIVSDIQIKLSSHVNRVGVLYLE